MLSCSRRYIANSNLSESRASDRIDRNLSLQTKEQLASSRGLNRPKQDGHFLGFEFWQLHKQDQPL